MYAADGEEDAVDGLGADGAHVVEHERVRVVSEVERLVLLGRRLEEQLRVAVDRTVEEDDGLRELAVVQHLLGVGAQVQMRRLVLKSELAAIGRSEAVDGLDERRLERHVEQVEAAQLAAEQVELVVEVGRAADEALVERLRLVDVERVLDLREERAVHVAVDLALRPPIVHVRNGDHVPLARLELELYAVLHLLAARLGLVAEDETRAHEVGRVAVALARAQPVQIGLLLLHVGAAHRIDAKPCAEREAVLVRPVADRRQ